MSQHTFVDEEEIDRDAEFAPVPDDVVEPPVEITDAQVEASIEPSRTSYEALDHECEKRFEVATYYRALLKGSLFDEDSEAARIVESEARAFFKERLETLMGIRATKPVATERSLPFSSEEIIALKAVAKRLVKKPELVEARPAEPVLRRTPAPNKPAPVTVHSASTKPVVRQQSTQKPQAIRPQAPKPVQVIQVPKSENGNGVIEDTGKIIKEGNKTYKLVRNELGSEFRQDITGQGKPTNRVPTPSPQMASQISEAQAARQISHLDIAIKGHHVGVNDLVNQINSKE